MDCLELQTAVNEIQPGRAVDIHCCAQHSLRERFLWAKICGTHGKVRKNNLNMKRRRSYMTDHDKYESGPGVRDRLVHHEVSKPVPEKYLPNHFDPPVPGRDALLGTATREKELPRQDIEVEPAESKERIVRPRLYAQKDLGGCIICHDSVIIC